MGVLLPSTTGALISSAIGMAMSLIPYQKKIFDLSTQGINITVERYVRGTKVDTLEVSKFADDKDAIEISQMEFNETSTTYNGRMIAVAKIPKVRVTLSLVPHSYDDVKLARMASGCSLYSTNGKRFGNTFNLTITQTRLIEKSAKQTVTIGKLAAHKAKAEFADGVLVSSSAVGTVAQEMFHGAETSATREGRFEASQYVFEFTTTRFIV